MREKGGKAGFTLIEMLVVIGIIGILAASLIGSFSHLKTVARQSQAHNQVSEVATAFALVLQSQREWPLAFDGKTEMDEDVCLVFQKSRLLEITTFKMDSSGNLKYKSASDPLPEKSKDSLDVFGMLDPWGRAALRRNPTDNPNQPVREGKTLIDHRIQFRLDKNYDGYVDASDGAPPNISVRASVIVWSRGPDGQDDFQSTNPKAKNRYPYDDRLSCPVRSK